MSPFFWRLQFSLTRKRRRLLKLSFLATVFLTMETSRIAYATFGFSYPSSNFNYSDYRFTDDTNTSPAANLYVGTWHEQLEKTFLGLAIAKNSLDGRNRLCIWRRTTKDGTQDRTSSITRFPSAAAISPSPSITWASKLTIIWPVMPPDPNASYILWGGGNDLFDDLSAQSVTDTANRVGVLIIRLANAGSAKLSRPQRSASSARSRIPSAILTGSQASTRLPLTYRTQFSSAVGSVVRGFAGNGITIHLYNLDVWLGLIRVLGQPAKYNFVNTIDSAQGASG